MPSKYRAQRTEVDGIVFHSKKEARRFSELKLLERAGEIEGLECQPKFPLHIMRSFWPGDYVNCGNYYADFRYTNLCDGEIIVEDVKGMKTPIYRLKKKMVEGIYGIQIRET